MAGTRRRPGRMGPFIESYRQELLGQGYKPLTVRGVLKHVGALGCWMEANGIDPADLNVEMLDSFVAFRRSRRSSVRTTRSLESLLAHLRDLGVVGSEPVPVVHPLIEAYRAWTFEERGLAPSTVLRYETPPCGSWRRSASGRSSR
jgi:hypothetical protein